MVINGLHPENRFKNTCGTQCMSDIAFQCVDRQVGKTGPPEGDSLHLVVKKRGRSMGIDKGDVLLADFFQCLLQCGGQPVGRLRRRTDMKGIIPYVPVSYLPYPLVCPAAAPPAGRKTTAQYHRRSCCT